VLRQYAGLDPETDPGIDVINEVTGYNTIWELLPAENPMDVLNLRLAAGEDYDYVFISGGNRARLADYANKGVVHDLTGQIDAYPNLNELPDLAWSTVTYDGRVYGIPSTGLPIPQQINFVREDWMQALGLAEPQTREELEAVVRTFAAEDPMDLGNANVAMLLDGPWAPGLTTTFGFLYPQELVDGTIVDNRTTDAYREYLSWLNSLYEDGILDPDFPVMTTEVYNSKITAGQVGYYHGWVDPAVSYVAAAKAAGDDESRYIGLETLKGPDGSRRNWSQAGPHNVGFIPASSTKVDSVLDWLDTFLEPENWELITIGVEGVDHEVRPDGRRFPILPRFDEIRNTMWALLPVQNGPEYFPLWQTRTRKNPNYYGVFDQAVPRVEPHKVDDPLAFLPVGEAEARVGKLVNDLIEEESIKFIAGARPLSEFDRYVDEIMAAGLAEILAEKQLAWDAK
jgi:putative aldouronate transport system substrate-binding protein